MTKPEIIQFMQEYCDSFRPGNADAVKKFFDYPTAMLANGMKLHIASPEELVSIISTGLEGLAKNGFSHSEIRAIHVFELSDDIAIVSARYDRLRSDNSVLEQIAATYNLFRGDDKQWKIVVISTHDADKMIGRE